MNMKTIVRSVILVMIFAVAVLTESCTTDATLANVDFNMKAKTNSSTIASGRLAATGLEFTEVRIGVTEMEFETLEEDEAEDSEDLEDSDGDGEDDNEEVEYEGEFIVDLITGTSMPDFGLADLAPGL